MLIEKKTYHAYESTIKYLARKSSLMFAATRGVSTSLHCPPARSLLHLAGSLETPI
jgi:hypothetical protein